MLYDIQHNLNYEGVMNMEAREQVLQALKAAPAPIKAGELVTATGLDKKEVDKAIKALKKDGEITSPKNCYYAAV